MSPKHILLLMLAFLLNACAPAFLIPPTPTFTPTPTLTPMPTDTPTPSATPTVAATETPVPNADQRMLEIAGHYSCLDFPWKQARSFFISRGETGLIGETSFFTPGLPPEYKKYELCPIYVFSYSATDGLAQMAYMDYKGDVVVERVYVSPGLWLSLMPITIEEFDQAGK